MSFSQKFTKTKDPLFGISVGFETNVQLDFSCDDSGNLLIRFVSLADNAAGNALIHRAIASYSQIKRLGGDKKGGVAGILEKIVKGKVVRVADDVLSFDPTPLLHVKVRSVSISDGTLSVKADVF